MESDPKVIGTRLAGKVAIVTGGGSGFGEAISKRFAEEGCKVIVADIDPIGGERVATFHPHEMHFIKTNVTSEEDWEQLMENALAKWGRVDILVNNAGTSYKNKVCIIILFMFKKQDVNENSSLRLMSPKMNLIRCLR
jgi:NAD(P)-dependent dehydrogenase (short-subunit alcohol dehydrogenase family)